MILLELGCVIVGVALAIPAGLAWTRARWRPAMLAVVAREEAEAAAEIAERDEIECQIEADIAAGIPVCTRCCGSHFLIRWPAPTQVEVMECLDCLRWQ